MLRGYTRLDTGSLGRATFDEAGFGGKSGWLTKLFGWGRADGLAVDFGLCVIPVSELHRHGIQIEIKGPDQRFAMTGVTITGHDSNVDPSKLF
jgi:hypothetical protein